MTPVWAALTSDKGDKGAEPVTEVIQRGIKQRLLKYLARVSRENRTPPSQRLRLQPTLSLRQQPLTSSSYAMCSYRHEHRGEPVRHGACLKLACLPENDALPQAASGGARGAGARRKSSVAGMEGVWAFHHLRRALLACCGAPAARGRRCDLGTVAELRPSNSFHRQLAFSARLSLSQIGYKTRWSRRC